LSGICPLPRVFVVLLSYISVVCIVKLCLCCMQFLDQCTAVLDLPFSARRLFDKKGVEHFNLANLTRDELVYVTCGEPWSDPTLSKSEQQRHFLLANIVADVSQMKQFVRLRNTDSELTTDHSLIQQIRYSYCSRNST